MGKSQLLCPGSRLMGQKESTTLSRKAFDGKERVNYFVPVGVFDGKERVNYFVQVDVLIGKSQLLCPGRRFDGKESTTSTR